MVLPAKNIDNIFMIGLLVLGISLIAITSNGFQHIADNCAVSQINTNLTVIMTLGAILVTIPVSYMTCKWRLQCDDQLDTTRLEIYVICIGIISLILIILIAIMLGTIKKDYVNCGGDSLKQLLILLLVLSIIIFLTCIGLTIFLYY
jgi:uncharacterized membrane protein YbjE (DUF340 family)